METKAKLPKKLLSMFLAVLIAFGCFSIALPNFVPEANAAASASQITALINAFKAADGHYGEYSVAGGTTYNVTITDNSEKGYIYNVANALFDVVNAEKSSYTHNRTMRDRVKSLCKTNGYEVTSYALTLLNYLIPTSGSYNTYYNSSNTHTNSDSVDRSWKWAFSGGGYNCNHGNLSAGLSATSLSATVTRTVKQAVLSDYATVPATGTSVNTSVKMTYTAAVSASYDHSNDGWTDSTCTRYAYSYYYNSAVAKSNPATGKTPDLSAVSAYLTYVAQDADSFASGYALYTNEANRSQLIDYGSDKLQTIYDNYTDKNNALASVDSAYISKFIGDSARASYTAYADYCKSLVEAVAFEDHVDWIVTEGFEIGGLAANDYLDIENLQTTIDSADRATLQSLYDLANKLYGEIGAVEGMFDALKSIFGTDIKAAYETYIEMIKDEIQKFDLRVIKDKAVFRYNNEDTEEYGSEEGNLFGIKGFEKYEYDVNGEECPISDVELQSAYSWYTAQATVIMTKDTENVTAVFGDAQASYIADIIEELRAEIRYRQIEVEYTELWNYFEVARSYIYTIMTYEYIVSMIETAEVKKAELVALYNELVSDYSQAEADFIFGNYLTVVDEFIASIKLELQTRVEKQLDKVKPYATDTALVIDFSNFVLIKTYINAVDHDLYAAALAKGLVTEEYQAIYAVLNNLIVKVDEFVATGGLANFEQNHYHDANGNYTTRYAGDQGVDADGNQIGFPNDIAREGTEENYVVNETKVNSTISKLDNFLVSEDFCALIGIKNEEGNAYNSLSDAIDDIIQTSLFTDDLVNTLIATIFPMITELLDGMLGDLSSLGVDGISKSPDANAAARIDLDTLSGGDFTGDLDLYIDGQYSSKKLIDVFESLGIYIYPQSFAKVLPSKYSALNSALTSAGKDWTYFDRINPTIDGVEREGYKDDVVDALDFAVYEWGVEDYDTFVDAVGVIFSALLPLLRTLLAGSDYSQEVEDLAYAKVYDMVLEDAIGSMDVTVYEAEAYANVTLKIAGETIFKDMWIPIMESLGVTDAGYDLTALGISGTYSFKSITSTSTAAQIADALFSPLLVLIEQLKQLPLNKILEIIPQLVYTLSFDVIQTLIDDIEIDISAEIAINSVEELKIIDIWGWQPDLAFLGNLLKSVLNGLLPSFDIPLALGDLVNLKDMLGIEYTNLNSLLSFVLEATGLAVQLPEINAGEIITCASVDKNASSAGSTGKRTKFTADKADVLYFLLQYIISAVGDRAFVEGLIELIQADEENFTIDTDGDGVPDAAEPIELPELVYKIIDGVNHNPMSALAALVELFVPQSYGKEEIDWVASQYDYAGIDGMNDAAILYLDYGNDWTKEKASYLIENVDAIVESVLKMTGSEETQINALIQKEFDKLLVNDNITAIVEGLCSLASIVDNDALYTIVAGLGADLSSMNKSFGYLFVADVDRLEEDFVEPLKPGDDGYVNSYLFEPASVEYVNVYDENNELVYETGEDDELILDKDGNPIVKKEVKITWKYNSTEFVDGDMETFVDLLCESIKGFAPVIATFFKGDSIGVFNNAIEFLGYDNYADSIGLFFELLGIEDVMTQAEYEAYCEENGDVAALNYTVDQLFNWLDGYLLEGNTVQKIIELLPNFIYFIESNGLSVVIHNLLMPVLVILDTVRPIFDLDLNLIASYLISDFLNYGELQVDILQLLEGIYVNDDLDYKFFSIDLGNITISEIVRLVDVYFGTNLSGSQLGNYGLKGLCSGVVEYDSVIEYTAYKTTVDAPDALTILITALLEAAEYVTADGRTNGEIICDFIDANAEDGEGANAGEIYAAVMELIKGFEITYTVPDWDYMFDTNIQASEKIQLPAHTITYLDYYSTDWTEDTAVKIEAALNDIIKMVLESTSGEGATVASLLNGVFNDNVYTDANLTAMVEGIVNLIAGLDETLRNTIDVVIDADIASWFAMCDAVEGVDEDGNATVTYKVKADKDWGVDAAETDEEKREMFVTGLSEVLMPAQRLLSWFLFGDDFAFFTGTEKDDEGNYTYNDIITLSGGQAYNYGLVPILEALGIEMPKAETFYVEVGENDGYYNIGLAIEAIIESVFDLVDEVSADPTKGVLDLLVNIIYFVNADGIKSSVNNILAPIDVLIGMFVEADSETGEPATIASLLEDTLGLDISDLSMETLLTIAMDNGIVFNEQMFKILCSFYVGELTQFTSANGNYAYRMTYTDEEDYHDMLTIVLAFAIDLVNLNEELFADLLGAETYSAVKALIAGLEVIYSEINWGYMYEGTTEENLEEIAAKGFPAVEFKYLEYSTNWTEDTADAVYNALDEILDMVLPGVLGDNENLKELVVNLLNDEVYTAQNLEAIVELIVNALAGFDASLYNAVGALLDADISTWFTMCELQNAYDEEGNLTMNEDGSIAQEYVVKEGTFTVTDKESFIAGLKTVLAPANELLAWLFFGDSYTFLSGTTNDSLITINGGEGYAYGLVPILEALGCEMESAASFYNAETKTYDVGAAVESILNSVLALVDKLAASDTAVEFVFTLLPNLLYFINADGLKTSVSNLLAPVNAIIGCLSGLVGEESIGALLTDVIGLDIENLNTATLLGLLETELGFVMNDEMKEAIYNIYGLGVADDFTSANGKTAYRVDVTGTEDDVLTVVLSFALDAFNLNEELFADLLGADEYKAVYNLIRGAKDQFKYKEIDWAYMYEGDDALNELQTNNLPEHAEDSIYAIYTQYANNWNKETAEYANEIIDKLVQNFFDEGSSLGQLVDNAITKGLYQDDILDSLIEAVVELLVDYAGIVEGAGALLGAESITEWFSDEYVEIDADGNVTCVKDWGVDAAVGNEAKREAFVEAFVDVLEPAYRLLSWLLFEEDYTFFNGTTNDPLITLTGGRGYEEAIVPLLEALGAKMPGMEGTYADGTTAIKPASAYELENGEIDMEAAVRDVFSALTDWLNMICGSLQNPGEYGTIGAMLDTLPNIIYNINAGTLKAVVTNLLVPVEEILGQLEVFGLEVDFSTLITIGEATLDIKNLDWYAVFDIVESAVGLYWPANVQEFLATLYMGKVVEYESANGKTAYYMTYNEEGDGTRADMITLIVSFVVDGYLDARNEKRLAGWLGEDIYELIYAYLSDTAKTVEMQKLSWILTEYANTGTVLSPVTLGSIYDYVYGELYTREMGEYIEKWLPSFVDTMIVLLGIEDENGGTYENLEDVLDTLIGDSIYTKANLEKILELVQGLIPTLKEEIGEDLFEIIVNVLNSALEIDLTYWDTYTVADFSDGDREAFVAELIRMLEPAYPILEWLLTDEDLIALFNTADGNDALVIEGAEGYAYGIIPLLEAFDYDSELILTPEEYKAQANGDPKKLLENILDPILNVVDTILADPVNEIFNVLPGIIYFLNSNGLDTVIKNTANAVFAVLENIEPLTGEIDIYELIGFDFADMNVETLLAQLLKNIEEDTGFRLEETAMEAITELTVGEVISFTSKNGDTAYTMKYATGADRVDMVTVILRAVLTFISVPENVVALEAILKDELTGDGYTFVCSLLENFSQMAASDDGMDEVMYTVYQIFYAANVAAHKTENWLAEFNGDYSFLNQLFATSDLAFIRQIGSSLGDLLNKYTGDIIDDDEIVPNGFLSFFDQIKAFFQKILDFFKGLFS